MRRLWSLLILALVACSGAPEPEDFNQRSARLSASAGRILGFEQASDWQASSGQRSLSTRRVEGASSLALTGPAFSEVRSAPLDTLGAVADRVTVDLLLPTAQPNPFWYGTIALVLHSPTLGLQEQRLGEQALTGRTLDTFHRFAFALTPAMRQKLSGASGAYGDLQVRVVLNVPAGSGTYLLDRLDFGLTPDSAAPLQPPRCEFGGRCLALISLPSNLPDENARFVAGEGLSLGDRTQILRAAGGPGDVASSGGGATSIGSNAQLRDVWSRGRVTLRNGAVVSGTVHSPQAPEIFAGTATPALDRATELEPLLPRNWVVTVPAAPAAAIDHASSTPLSLAPGAFSGVAVKPSATLRLRSGTYYFGSLQLESGSRLELDQRNGPVFIYVLTSLSYRGRVSVSAGNAGLLLGYFGTAPVVLEAAFDGTLVAPYAAVSLSSVAPARYAGAFFARQLDTQPGVVVTLGGSLVPGATTTSRDDCARLLTEGVSVSNEAQSRQLHHDLLVYCLAPGIPACDARLTTAANLDRSAAAQRYQARTFESADYLAIARDRSRKLHGARRDSSRMSAYCSGDADGDLVGDPLDQCPNTPPLTPTDDRGCTVTARPPAAPRAIVDEYLKVMGILRDPRCDGHGTPAAPTARVVGWRPGATHEDSVTFILDVGAKPPAGCDIWYEVSVYDPYAPPGAAQHYEFAFSEREVELEQIDADGARTLWFHIEGSAAGARGEFPRSLAQLSNARTVFVAARATSAAGLQSTWSGAYPLYTLTLAP